MRQYVGPLGKYFHKVDISIACGMLGNMSLSMSTDTDRVIPILVSFFGDGLEPIWPEILRISGITFVKNPMWSHGAWLFRM